MYTFDIESCSVDHVSFSVRRLNFDEFLMYSTMNFDVRFLEHVRLLNFHVLKLSIDIQKLTHTTRASIRRWRYVGSRVGPNRRHADSGQRRSAQLYGPRIDSAAGAVPTRLPAQYRYDADSATSTMPTWLIAP